MPYYDPNAKTYPTYADALAAAQAAKEKRKADKAAEVRARRDARNAERLARAKELAERGKGGFTPVIRALDVGESFTATQYTKTSQVSAALARIYIATGQDYTSEVVPNLITGEGAGGVKVTRIK